MCWSGEVSAAFAAIEWAGIAWLWRRNTRFDRPFAIALSPIAAQEALQWLLWEHIATSPGDCDRVNAIGSLAVRLIIGLVPLAWVWFARRGAPASRLARGLLLATAGYVVGFAALVVTSFAVGPRRCTIVGPNHHQEWASYLDHYAPVQPALNVGFFTLYWSLPVAALLLCFRPRWLAISISAVTVGTMTGSLLLLSEDELGSVWCWSCSLLLALALVHPRFLGPAAQGGAVGGGQGRPSPRPA